jgi:hypothetical protein
VWSAWSGAPRSGGSISWRGALRERPATCWAAIATRAINAASPLRYVRAAAGSKLDPFREWICGQVQADPGDPVAAVARPRRGAWVCGRQSSFDNYVREIRARFVVPRTFQCTVSRPGELVQCDLWEPRAHVPVGHWIAVDRRAATGLTTLVCRRAGARPQRDDRFCCSRAAV